MALKLKGSTSGFTAIDAPATAGDNTLVLPADNGSASQYLQTDGSGVLSWATVTDTTTNLTRGTVVAATSGTTITFTGIPATARKITMILDQVSLSGGDTVQARIGDSGGIETTGYDYKAFFLHTGNYGSSVYTSGFGFRWESTAGHRSGHFELYNITGNVWVGKHLLGTFAETQTSGVSAGAGRKELSDTLTQIQLTSVGGTQTFDNGQVNVMWEV